ncbi:hypothetical protein [Luteolibacter sp. Populi]|uniref:hypothetical protein n=1 Tax=Luteolibacter sp. Populi TaxID=3230487 RepID=UPI003466B3B5
MSPHIRRTRREQGFALVITLTLMVLLTILATGLLTLSTISLRTTGSADAQAQAYANARLSVMMAIGQLQKHAGDDRRITADASIANGALQEHLVGAWDSWSPKFILKTDNPAVNYGAQKTSAFRGWLMSHPDQKALEDRAFASNPPGMDWVKLFTADQNGFDLAAAPIGTKAGNVSGAIAWAVSQENTKAKINVAGPEDTKELPKNSVLQSQRRPSLASAKGLKNAKDGFNTRANKVISMNQIELDGNLAGSEAELPTVGASYTVHSKGLLTDVVWGGLKSDMSLGFEMSDSEFKKSSWGGTPNPFRGGGSRANLASPGSFAGQLPLFRPMIENPIVAVTTEFAPATVANRFYGAGVPTFDHLRSFYRIPHYLYGGAGGVPIAAERGVDHIAAKSSAAGGGTYLSPAKPPPGQKSVTAIRPVLNRVVYLLSMGLGSDNEVRLVMTPVISLWNPYNTALEIDGAVAYPWIDVPWSLTWNFSKGPTSKGVGLSTVMGYQFETNDHGRQVNPYFLCKMSSNGTDKGITPIRFEPGEVRVFAPSTPTPVNYERTDGIGTISKTIWMRPVDNVTQFSTKGGLAVPMRNGVKGAGFSFPMAKGDSVSLRVNDTGGNYNYFVSLEDGTRIKNPVPLGAQGGQAVAEVQMFSYASTTNTEITSTSRNYEELTAGGAIPFGVIETFARTALPLTSPGGQTQQASDLVYTVNPRQPSINKNLTAGSSTTMPPHYVSTMRAVSSFDGAVKTTSDGRRSFWGAGHDSLKGQSILPFFELPREPMLSLGGFQHADLASSAFSPAFQFGNSWASAWLRRTQVATRNQTYAPTGVPIYDTCYLTNEALWDGYFFSGAAPWLGLGSKPTTTAGHYDKADGDAPETRSLKSVVEGFVDNPLENPLGNPRMQLYKGGVPDQQLKQDLLDPAGCVKIAAHLLVDGAFNVNSTDEEAWVAVLSGLRGEDFEVDGGGSSPSNDTAFPRFRHPTGGTNGIWNGFRTLNDAQIRTLAQNIVTQVRARGPFQSLAEFVNRRIENNEYGKSGAIQAAIDIAKVNDVAKQGTLPTLPYPPEGKANIIPDTGVGIPGYLTQADVLQSLAPVITCRSDTFTIRGYGEAHDGDGKVIANAWCEAVVQRMPDFVEREANAPESAVASLTEVNQTFGRRFEIVSIRRIPRPEILP